jgi:hypothetical protein
VALAACLAAAAPARAQDVAVEAVPGSEAERYLRALQISGAAPLYPWSVRGFSPAELDRLVPADSTHPWGRRTGARGSGVRLVRPRVDLAYNSGFPQGGNDGAVWAGRGATASGSAGVQARAGVLSLRVEPVAFWAQNRSFPLMETDGGGDSAFADPVQPERIDFPQRFGDGAYARVDPGQSTLRLDARGFAVGVSTANQQWGPAVDQPLLLGPAGPGFLHAFAGTASPWKVGIGRVHGRLVWGDLRESAYSRAQGPARRRLMAGFTGVFLPWGLDGLEIGFSRFFHIPHDSAGLDSGDYLRPLEALFKVALPATGYGGDRRSDQENQLAAVHARWVLPGSGVEVYGEYAREDHAWDLLDLYLEPDHDSAYLLGGAHAWRRGRSLLWLRAEWVNSQISHLVSARAQALLYRHTRARQGHTHRGQLLGSAAGYGGGGSVVALEAFTPRGRWSLDWTRTRVRDNWGLAPAQEERPEAATDVVHSLGGEAAFFRGPVDVVARLRAGWELNRNFDGDAFNLSAALGLRFGF